MEILGFVLAAIMGFTLGLLGGGGSVLTVPILVYILGINPILATAYSLFVVGSTALIGGIRKYTLGMVEWKTGVLFAVPSVIAIFLTRYMLLPIIPPTLFRVFGVTVTKEVGLMILFGVIMLVASYSLIKGRAQSKKDGPVLPRFLMFIGMIVGFVAGMVGAGGGFLIVPALVLLVRLPIKKAIGTSLAIIAVQSLTGFMGDIGSGQNIDWSFLLLFTLCSIGGMFVGNFASRMVDPSKLKKGFGYFVFSMGIVIIITEIFWQGAS